MKGRLEHNLQKEKLIKGMLDELPKYVVNYYYSFKQGRQPGACIDYLRTIRLFLTFVSERTSTDNLKDVKLEEISSVQVVSEYMDTIKIRIVNGEQVETSISLQQKTHTILNSFFTYLYDENYIDRNPMRNIRRRKGRDVVERRFLKEEDLKALLAKVEEGYGTQKMKAFHRGWENRDRAMLMLFMETGIRETALTEINVEDIDFSKHTISVVNKGHKEYVYKFEDQLGDVLLDWLDDRKKLLNGKKCDALFISRDRTRMSRSTVVRIVNLYSEEVLGYRVSPHKLRAAFANIILRKSNGNIYLVQRMLDHSSPDTTKIYLDDISEKDKENVANTISELIF